MAQMQGRKGITMPIWLLAPLLAWAITAGSGSIWIAVADHYELNGVLAEIQRINDEGSRRLRLHLQEEARANQQMIYMQTDVTEMKRDVKAMRDDVMELKLILQQAVTSGTGGREGDGGGS